MPLKDDLKSVIIKNGWTMKAMVCELNKRHGKNTTAQIFSSRLSRGNLKYTEVEEILDILGYKIKWIK